MKKIIGLLTDFGLHDSYVGVMKAVMLNISPDFHFIDISHSIRPFSITDASYILFTAWDYFPKGSVFLSVVDPGVGTSRKTLVYHHNGKFCVTPDNGTISMLTRMYDSGDIFLISEHTLKEVRISDRLIPGITGTQLKVEQSSTFHGRDIFAPLAARIALHGMDSIKTIKGEPVIMKTLWPYIDLKNRNGKGIIIHIDRFGNCISSFHYSDLSHLENESLSVKIMNTMIQGIKKCFSDVSPGEFLLYIGSSGFLEIAKREGNAAEQLLVKQGMEIFLEF